MKKYADNEPSGWVVKDYGAGLFMIKAANQTQGRCLFFTVRPQETVGQASTEELVALLAYKKETQEAPDQMIETARQRLKKSGRI